MAEPQSFCLKILAERTTGTTPTPNDRQIDIAVIAFGGGGTSDIREKYKGIRIDAIANSIRTVRNAIRRNEVPDIIKTGFPQICIDQQVFSKLPEQQARSVVGAKIKALAKAITEPTQQQFASWVTQAKVLFARVGVPITVQKMLEGVERGDPEMIKLSTQVFHLVPTGGKGLTLAQQFNMGGSQEKKPPAERRAPYFERLLRGARGRIDSEHSQTVEVTASEEQ